MRLYSYNNFLNTTAIKRRTTYRCVCSKIPWELQVRKLDIMIEHHRTIFKLFDDCLKYLKVFQVRVTVSKGSVTNTLSKWNYVGTLNIDQERIEQINLPNKLVGSFCATLTKLQIVLVDYYAVTSVKYTLLNQRRNTRSREYNNKLRAKICLFFLFKFSCPLQAQTLC